MFIWFHWILSNTQPSTTKWVELCTLLHVPTFSQSSEYRTQPFFELTLSGSRQWTKRTVATRWGCFTELLVLAVKRLTTSDLTGVTVARTVRKRVFISNILILHLFYPSTPHLSVIALSVDCTAVVFWNIHYHRSFHQILASNALSFKSQIWPFN